MMILPQIGRGQIGLAVQNPMMQEPASASPYAALAQQAQAGQSFPMMGGTTPGTSIVPQLPMNVQHPVAQLPQNMGAGQAAAGNQGAAEGLKGMQQLMGGLQKGAQGLQKQQGSHPGSLGQSAALQAPQGAPQANMLPSTAFNAPLPPAAQTPPAAPTIEPMPVGLLGGSADAGLGGMGGLGGLSGLGGLLGLFGGF